MEIEFYKENNWEAACLLKTGAPNHEYNFGCYLKSIYGSGSLTIDSVEHAKAIQQALQYAIDNKWLFTKEELKKVTRVTDTRTTLRKRLNDYSK